MQEITIKVPAPFAGVSDLGFTAQYPSQMPFAPLRDVPLLIEGPPHPMRRLADRLRVLVGMDASAHAWSEPLMLSDEVVVIAFRDRSLSPTRSGDLAGTAVAEDLRASLDYVLNLVRPVAFPFLQDCARWGGLRLSDRIELRVENSSRQIAELQLRQEQIVEPNGDLLLW